MALRKVNFIEHEIYHVYNRGAFKHDIFHDDSDCQRFQKILFLSNGTKKFKYKDLLKYNKNIYKYDIGERIVNILAFVLMPNHFHLLIEIKPQSFGKNAGVDRHLDNNLSVLMKRVTAAYSMYYNKKYHKTGALFEGKFKAEHVSDNLYFKYLFSYIHLNPIKLIQKDWKEIGIKDFTDTRRFLGDYRYSSFKDYFPATANSKTNNLVDTELFYRKIEPGTDLNKEIFDWMKYRIIN